MKLLPAFRSQVNTGFTLIEVVIAVMVMAIAVPPTLSMMDSASAGRVDSVNTTRATFLSTIVLETVMADMTSSDAGLGFDALINSSAYLDTPPGAADVTLGLYQRLTTITEPYTQVGLGYSVEIGALVGSDGQVSVVESENVFRMITVRIQFMSASGDQISMPVSIMVSEM
ncbi:MAG: prepilin-type N-terminal cleavage/methylation domain-containing protein [Phycisphaerales bacterium]|nr:prepilin-type N-terminal cleavage/methylation domain-containing protein [Phycisphaerales bacterium]